ncbi:MAG TPA: NUDIX domain-containing protein [Limnochordia bacterium]|nr:NUDIX domain-containing protein [Limnochordia bacterium]
MTQLGTARLLMLRGDRILLAQHNNRLPENLGKWGLPGGRIDPEDPSPEAAARRELREEFALEAGELNLVGDFSYRDRPHRVFAVQVAGEITSWDRSEILAIGWFSLDEVADLHYAGRLHTNFEYDAFRTWIRAQPQGLVPHDDAFLAERLGGPIATRERLHEWPLSAVYRLQLNDGRRVIYKVQRPPTLEPEIYARVRSELLPRAELIDVQDGCTHMFMEELHGATLEPKGLSPGQLLELGRPLVEAIARFPERVEEPSAASPAGLPVFCDVSSEALWQAFVRRTIGDLRGLVAAGHFAAFTPERLERLEGALAAPQLARWAAQESAFAHGDFHHDNVMVVAGRYRVLDWQRPWRGPKSVDLAILLERAGHDAYPHLGGPAVQMRHALLLNWWVQGATRWVPQGRDFFEHLALRAAERIVSPEGPGA